MGGIGAPELVIILVVVLLFFGGAKLPQLARSLGQAQREFRAGHDDTDGHGGATSADDRRRHEVSAPTDPPVTDPPAGNPPPG